MFKKVLKKVVSFVSMVLIFMQPLAVQAETSSKPLDRLGSNINNDFEELSRELRDTKALLKAILAVVEKDQRLEKYSEVRGVAQAKEQAETLAPRTADAVEKVLGNERLDKTIGKELREKLLVCAQKIKSNGEKMLEAAAEGGAGAAAAQLGDCPPDEAQRLLGELEKQRQQTLQTWNQCRDALLSTGKVLPTAIPRDPIGIARDGGTQNLKEQIEKARSDIQGLGGDIETCADRLGDTFQKLQDQEDAAAAMAMMMNFAATACMASGANPYVCGAMFLVAILASLFSDGGGDGDGDGESDGTGEAGDGTVTAGSGPKNVPPAPDDNNTPPAPANVWGNVVNGEFECQTEGSALACKEISSGTTVNIDHARIRGGEGNLADAQKSILEAYRAAISQKNVSAVEFCKNPGGGVPLIGVILIEGGNYFPLKLLVDPAEPLDFTKLQLAIPPGGNAVGSSTPDQRCSTL
ncbi:hypothetical protein [Roseibium aggregatum]|uniref:hypothetical protein n=1 Tax=Roseibium aggregatum TaxID=187304 RepID=UPI001E31DEEB|nr:hypothetical protein [Roseibium aggregatum]